jgi:uncharacterized protein
MFRNPPADEIRHLLETVHTIAVVGFSNLPHRPSYGVASAMQQAGYRIVPVRPGISEGLGERAFARLADIPETPDLVDVFRAPQHVPAIVDDCIALGIRVLWLQEGVVDEDAAEKARAAGIQVVMDRCIWKDYMAMVA